ncbi:MAG: DAK2 domain-containing protein [Christensenellaceae bacterium]
MIKTLDGKKLKEMILGAAVILEQNKDTLDALNVFPVPDGDTGTNMSLTMMAAAKEVAAADESNDASVIGALSLGALKGARGNSGVILSQIFSGFCDACLKAETTIDTKVIACALTRGVEYAYKAVMKPKEGTILTVAKSMAQAAEEISVKTDDIYKQLEHVIIEGEKTLRLTPEMLPVLKEAGVVDAGGAGFLVIVMGFKAVLDGDEIDSEKILGNKDAIIDFSNLAMDKEDIEFGYCTEFFIKNLYEGTKERDIDTFRNNLSKIGDCVLVVGDLNLVKTHVHTNEPGLALQYAQILGELSKIKIDNMREQHRELSNDVPPIEKKDIAVIAVAAGEGIKDIFDEWHIDGYVEGGQSMNPSTQDILQAIENAPSKNVLILPNNKNIILAAEQAVVLCNKNVAVIKSKSIPQGIAAAIVYDPDKDLQSNEKRMSRAVSEIKTGLITNAVRDTKMNGNSIKQGELIGIFENDIVVNDAVLRNVFVGLVGAMTDEDSELLCIYYGEDATQQDAEELAQLSQKEFSQLDIEVRFGGQPVYPFMISVE